MVEIALTVNGEPVRLLVEPAETLLDVLRERLRLTGTKRGCDSGDCGACTVLLDGEPVNSCLVLAPEADGCEVVTVEGVEHPVQERFCRAGAFQCGFCAPGVVVSAVHLLERDPHPDEAAVREALSGHLCRCTGYLRMIRAIRDEMEEEAAGAGDDRYRVVGRPVVRKDIEDKVRGRARYTADLYFPGLVYGALVTSPHPHARVVEVDPSEALAMEGVVLALTPDDVPDTPYGVSPARYDETVLPKPVVRHVGEPVAAVFATSRRLAELAAARVRVRYEPLPAVFDPEAAMAEGAPRIHERYERNVNTEIHHDFGDVEAVFERAPYVREDTFRGQRTHQAYLEPPAALAVPEGDTVTLWTASQTPRYVAYNVARVLGIPESSLRVVKPAMGGGFGGKAEATALDFLAVIAARRLGRPVLMVMDRRQAFEHGRGRHAQTIRLRSAFDREGRLLAVEERVVLDGGAYTGYGIITAYYSGALTTTPYRIRNFRFDAFRVVTNLPACGAQRGNGTPQPRWAFESQLDVAARELGLDPVQIRRRNLIEPGYVTVNQLRITSCGVRECLDEVVRLSGFDRKHGRLPFGRGIGLALGCFISGAGGPIVRGDVPHSMATIRVAEDGRRAWVLTGAPDIGQGSDTILCQIAAEALGLPYERVSILSADTAVAPKDLGAYASRITFMAGNATLQAARGIRRRLGRAWREVTGRPARRLRYRDGTVTDGEVTVPFEELAVAYQRRHGPLVATGSYSPPKLGGSFKGASVGTSPAYSFCAVAAEVTVDPETGAVRVERFWAAHDSGTVINPATFHGQVEGALVMGMGEALFEKVEHVGGALRNPNLHDYLLPTAADAPEIVSVTVPVRDPEGPFGAKEVGEGAILPVMGAIANAVEDAVGVRVRELPITAEAVWRGLRGGEGS